MKISIARALKEKNRIIGEMKRLNGIISQKNCTVAWVPVSGNGNPMITENTFKGTNTVDLDAVMNEYQHQRERLVAIKTAITKANADIADALVALSEAKSHITNLSTFRTGRSENTPSGTTQYQIIRWKFDVDWVEAEKKRYTDIVNKLQDTVDEFNASHYIEFDV